LQKSFHESGLTKLLFFAPLPHCMLPDITRKSSHSPYHNLQEGIHYPATFITAADMWIFVMHHLGMPFKEMGRLSSLLKKTK